MEDELIAFKTAKLAKAKGFKEKTKMYFLYDQTEKSAGMKGTSTENWNKWFDDERVKYCSRPTQSLLQRWLRETHNLHVYPELTNNRNVWDAEIINVISDKENNIHASSKQNFNSFEEALEFALFEGLKFLPDAN